MQGSTFLIAASFRFHFVYVTIVTYLWPMPKEHTRVLIFDLLKNLVP